MDHSEILLILRELNLNEDCVANIYHHGSWVYGTNTTKSDRDIIIVTHLPYQNPLKFWSDYDYFHDFEIHKLPNNCDVCIYSVENFETLLEKNFLIAVQCVFLPDEFKLKEEIDFRTIYLETYYNQLRLKQAGFYEMLRDLKLYNPNINSYDSFRCLLTIEKFQARKDHVFKNLFHGLRYLDFVEQLLQTRTIHNYKRVSYLFDEMKEIRRNSDDDSYMERVVEFVRTKSDELKAKLDVLVPTNIIKGEFEAQITLDCTDNPEQVIEKLRETKYKIKFIQLDTYHAMDDKPQRLIASSFYFGEYPSIVQQIEEEAYNHFRDIKILRIKIKSLASNEGVPKADIEKRLFWNKTINYFEFYYNVPLGSDRRGEKLKKLQNKCRSKFKLNVKLSRDGIKQVDEKDFNYMITMRLFDVSQHKAFEVDDGVVECSINDKFSVSKITHAFIIYDTNVELDNDER